MQLVPSYQNKHWLYLLVMSSNQVSSSSSCPANDDFRARLSLVDRRVVRILHCHDITHLARTTCTYFCYTTICKSQLGDFRTLLLLTTCVVVFLHVNFLQLHFLGFVSLQKTFILWESTWVVGISESNHVSDHFVPGKCDPWWTLSREWTAVHFATTM